MWKRDDGWIRKKRKTVMGDCATGTWDFSVFSCLSKFMEGRQTENRRHGKDDEREFNLIYPHDFSMFWLYGSNIHCHYCLAIRDQERSQEGNREMQRNLTPNVNKPSHRLHNSSYLKYHE